MNKKVLVTLAAVGIAAFAAKADVAFSVSFGTYHYTPRHCYTPPVVCQPAPVVFQPAPVVYQPAPVMFRPAPVFCAPAPQICETPRVVYSAPVCYTPRVNHSRSYAPVFSRIPENNCSQPRYSGHYSQSGWNSSVGGRHHRVGH